jgi:hypothetical protein
MQNWYATGTALSGLVTKPPKIPWMRPLAHSHTCAIHLSSAAVSSRIIAIKEDPGPD